MFIKGNLREHERRPFITPLKYSVSVINMQELKKVHTVAVSVDVSDEGLGIITDFPVQQGHVLTFEGDKQINNSIFKKAAIVRWTGKIHSQYRAGLQFV
jgi:c-di-GMP-binding flagellar brake protein YcgR